MAHSEYLSAFNEDKRIDGLPSIADLALISIETWPQAMLFMNNEDLRVVWMNDAASRLLREHTAGIKNGRIHLSQRGQQKSFEEFLSGSPLASDSWSLDLTNGRGALVFRCRMVPETGHTLLSIYSTEVPSTHLPDVKGLLGLTPSEARIVKGLVGGRRADELSEDLGVSLETVRTHIRRIYLKTGVNSREQLIAKVSAFRVP
jgi:DNA-binding CsgD family transcriptional regulator